MAMEDKLYLAPLEKDKITVSTAQRLTCSFERNSHDITDVINIVTREHLI